MGHLGRFDPTWHPSPLTLEGLTQLDPTCHLSGVHFIFTDVVWKLRQGSGTYWEMGSSTGVPVEVHVCVSG